MNNNNYYQPYAPKPRQGRNRNWPIILGCLGILGMLFVAIGLGGYFYLTASAASQSVVFIRSPQDGERVEAGQPVQVRALARGDQKIVRLELWVDGQLLDVETSSIQNGISPFPLLTTWVPQAGTHTLIARAFNSRNATSQTAITVEAVALADRDGDTVADEADSCPDQQGNPAADGCPDRDFDGIADASDACPDVAGMSGDGCPAPNESDHDGDGVLNEVDACPEVAGSPLAHGCHDADGDGVGDASDACPSEPGRGVDGCPEAGGAEAAPESGVDDSVPPEPIPGVDPPLPGGDPVEPGIGIPFFVPPLRIYVQLELEAVEMLVGRDYENIWCYVRLNEEDMRRYDFETLGERHWNAAEVLGGENSLHLLQPLGDPLRIRIACFGSEPGSGELAYSGEISLEHPSGEWDGRALTAHIPGDSDNLMISYRICSPSCDQDALQIPDLAPINTGPIGEGPYALSWRWEGNSAQIDGFGLSISSISSAATIDIPHPGMRSLNIADYRPACGETVYFQMFAYQDHGEIRSPLSNTQAWTGKPCSRQVKVTFAYMDTDLQYIGGDYTGRGPIYGSFYATSGSDILTLGFDGGRCWAVLWIFSCNGYAVSVGRYNIAGMFNAMRAEEDGHAPDVNHIIVELNPGDDLSFGGSIWDEEAYGGDHRLFHARHTIAADETLPAEIILEDVTGYGRVSLTVRIEEISGP
jgi:hypothetical protein